MNIGKEFNNVEKIVIGVGNILFGDDGFGPKVIEYLKSNYDIKENVLLIDAGTAVREILFDILLSDIRLKEILLIDSVDLRREPGEILELKIPDIPLDNIDRYELHNAPSTNLLRELLLKNKVDSVRIFACQVGKLPEEIKIGLSREVEKTVPILSDSIYKSFLS